MNRMRFRTPHFIAAGMLAGALLATGCSSVGTRSKGTKGKVYPGLRTVESYGNGEISGMMGLADLTTSIALDTILLPYDLASEPRDEFPPVLPTYTNGIFSGIYRSGFEKSEFAPTTSREKWYLRGDPLFTDLRLTEAASEARAKFKDPVFFIIVEGSISSLGGYGHLDQYKRELVVTRILEVRHLPPD